MNFTCEASEARPLRPTELSQTRQTALGAGPTCRGTPTCGQKTNHVGRWIGLACFLSMAAAGAETPASWESALAGMPLPEGTRTLERTNCIPLMLDAFRPAPAVRALVFLPGATDEFYHFRRATARLSVTRPTLFDAVVALTNQTLIRASFRAPFLLLHALEDPTEPLVRIEHEATAARLRRNRFVEHANYSDRDWDFLQPVLERRLNVFVRPVKGTPASWHFYRHSFAGWGLSGMETLEATSLAGMTTFTVKRRTVDFIGDTRPRFGKRAP